MSRSNKSPRSGTLLGRMVRAEPLEEAVLKVIREVLLTMPDLKQQVKAIVSDLVRPKEPVSGREQVERALKRKQRQLEVALESLTGDTEVDQGLLEAIRGYREEIARLAAQRRQAPLPRKPVDVDGAADALWAELQDFGTHLDAQDHESIHEMLKLLIVRGEVDLETLEVEFELALPGWVQRQLEVSCGSLVRDSASRTPNEASTENRPVAIYRCETGPKRPPCFRCRRKAA